MTETTIRRTLPAEFYTNPAFLDRELDYFFLSQWVCVGRADQIEEPGKYFLREIAGESILVVRDENQMVRAYYNVCRHRGTRLTQEPTGCFKTKRIQCPYHAWTYSLSGALLGAPHMAETPGFALSDYRLQVLPCEQWDGHLFVCLDPNPKRRLSEQLGELVAKFRPWHMEELRLAKRINYPIQANWKLIVQNYSECLHCPMIHPALAKISHYMSGDNEPARPNFLGGRMDLNAGIQTMTMSGRSERQTLPYLGEEERRHVYYYWVLPNLLLSLHPDYVMTHTIWPKNPGFTEVICEFHFHKDEIVKPGFSPDDAVEFWDLTNRQDWHVSELSQAGIRSRGYQPGPYSTREGLLYDFDQIVRGVHGASI